MADFTVSTGIDTFLQSADNAAARDSLRVIEYPYTTDFKSGTEQTRNLTSITTSAGYYFNSNLTSIYVGSNVTSIGSSAFGYCTALTSITIGNSVTTLGSYSFSSCVSLTSIVIPDSVTSIGLQAFNNSTSLTSATIGNSVTSIGSGAFYYCSSATTINCLATTAPTIGAGAFSGVAATDIHVPVGATGYGTTYGGLTVVADL